MSARIVSRLRMYGLIILIGAVTFGCAGCRKKLGSGLSRLNPFRKKTSRVSDDERFIPPPKPISGGPLGKGVILPDGTSPDEFGIPATPPLRQEPRGMLENLKTVYFAFDSFALNEDSKAVLDQNADYLKEHPEHEVQIQGHCDERGTLEYNFNLGMKRANAVREYLAQRGITAERLHVISYGEERPIDPDENEQAWAQNRRAQFLVY